MRWRTAYPFVLRPNRCTALSLDRQEHRHSEALYHFHDRAVGLVGDDLREDIEAADHLAELALEAEVRARSGAVVGQEEQLALRRARGRELPHRDLDVARRVVEALRRRAHQGPGVQAHR